MHGFAMSEQKYNSHRRTDTRNVLATPACRRVWLRALRVVKAALSLIGGKVSELINNKCQTCKHTREVTMTLTYHTVSAGMAKCDCPRQHCCCVQPCFAWLILDLSSVSEK